jgi:phenylpropionate dioxygenase-like ring-hydroxylating dioxygenase large terminal subunit
MSTVAELPTRPVLSLDARYYTDPAVYEREKEAVFYRTWQFAGHEADIPRTGDYFTFSICGQDLFCIRDKQGAVRCYYNVCQHRAHGLLTGTGNKRRVVCPYHAWSYDLDGKLKSAPNAEATPGFDFDEVCLTEVRVEMFVGFIFVNMDAGAAPMDDWFPGVREELADFVPQIRDLKLMTWTTVDEDCNWKVSVENYSECYHCELNHPTFASGVIQPKSYNIKPQGYCLRHTTETASADGMTYDYDPTTPHATEYSSWFLWPAFSFQVYPGNTLNTYLWRPTGVETVEVNRGWYTVGGEETEVASRLADQDFNTTVLEDVRLVNSVQRGLNNRGYRPGPLILDPDEGLLSEHSIRALQTWTLEALEVSKPAE